jgi:hypothetical protein
MCMFCVAQADLVELSPGGSISSTGTIEAYIEGVEGILFASLTICAEIGFECFLNGMSLPCGAFCEPEQRYSVKKCVLGN